MIEMPTRRALLGGGAAIAAAGFMPMRAQAFARETRLAVRNVHNNERHEARIVAGGRFDIAGLAELDHALRDWRSGAKHAIDPNLLLLVASLRDRLGVSHPVDLISGYRSPGTNAGLRATGHHGVASQSQHMAGKAMDIRMPGVDLSRLHAAALDARAGGVGFYPTDNFVHVDTGPIRRWFG